MGAEQDANRTKPLISVSEASLEPSKPPNALSFLAHRTASIINPVGQILVVCKHLSKYVGHGKQGIFSHIGSRIMCEHIGTWNEKKSGTLFQESCVSTSEHPTKKDN